ncbi:MAG TPA: HNH endonuclease [Allosphingosinicella sp.]|nr:HNH endonuclease [Allosphingosinicella sp.]
MVHGAPLAAAVSEACFLCGRPLGSRTEWHHVLPKSRGGRETAPVHPICHRAIHAALSNTELARAYVSADALRAHPEIARFLSWVRGKEPDFHAPTRGRKA